MYGLLEEFMKSSFKTWPREWVEFSKYRSEKHPGKEKVWTNVHEKK